MKKAYFDIFCECFPSMEMTYVRFCELLDKDNCIFFERKESDEIVSFAIIEDCAVRLLCVTPSMQKRGIGSEMLSEIEEYVRSKGYDQLLTGGVSSRLFIGAPSESWGFWAKNDFSAEDGCDEMLLKLEDFHMEGLPLHGSDIAEYGWYDGDIETLKSAVASVNDNWPQYYTESSKIYVGKVNDEIASFCLVDTNCQNYLTDKYGKVGMPGCVGSVPKFRNKGIALEMVARVTRYLKEQGMDISFIYYTGVPEWYKKIGYRTFLSERFGVKKL